MKRSAYPRFGEMNNAETHNAKIYSGGLTQTDVVFGSMMNFLMKVPWSN